MQTSHLAVFALARTDLIGIAPAEESDSEDEEYIDKENAQPGTR